MSPVARSIAAVLVAVAGCAPVAVPVSVVTSVAPAPTGLVPAVPGTRLTPPAVQFVTAGPLHLALPADWTLQCLNGTGDTKLRGVAPASAGGVATFTVDVPSLPWHPPGLIPLSMVANGYADDVAKRMPDAAGPPPADVAVTAARAERVTRTGHDAAGQPATDDAVVIVHGDAVYILSIDADDAARPAAEAALNAAVASVTWTR